MVKSKLLCSKSFLLLKQRSDVAFLSQRNFVINDFVTGSTPVQMMEKWHYPDESKISSPTSPTAKKLLLKCSTRGLLSRRSYHLTEITAAHMKRVLNKIT